VSRPGTIIVTTVVVGVASIFLVGMFVVAAGLVLRWIWWTVSAPFRVVGFCREYGVVATIAAGGVWLFSLVVLSLWALVVVASA
jgi:hypothetical protein